MVSVQALVEQIKTLRNELSKTKFEYTHMISQEIAKWYHLREDRIFTIITNGGITLTHPDNEMFKLSFDTKELLLKHLVSLITLHSAQKTIKFYEIEPNKVNK